jgi:hypothetical protein
MASIKHEILTKCPRFQPGTKGPSRNTLSQYKTHAIKFGQWAKSVYGCRTYESLKDHIQDYSNFLYASGKRPATIHTYIAACCFAWNIPMEHITKPHRHCYDAKRSRSVAKKEINSRADTKRDVSPRLFDFAEKVGIRRHEYLALRQDDFVTDESGYLCVFVRKGKGGKQQLQRILPDDIELVQSYFNGSDDFVFTKAEMDNKIDLHRIRADAAKCAYNYYVGRLRSEPGYREQLEHELQARWELHRGTPPANSKKKHDWDWDISRVRGKYCIRGKNRDKALQNGLPVAYDRLAVMAVSIFHLSHWRCDVTVDHYLLSI